MKTTKIISACAVLVALASCSSDHELSQQSAEATPIRIQANVGGITTRAGSNIQGTQFDEGETIGIFLKEHLESGETKVKTYSNPITGTVTIDAPHTYINLRPTQYFPANGRGVDCLAIYPMKIGDTDTNIDKDINSFSVQEDQSSEVNYKKSDLMYAYTANTPKKTIIPLTFKHLLSKIIVEVVADPSVNKDVLSDVYVDLLNTNKTIDITVDDIAQGSVSANKKVAVGGNAENPGTIVMGQPGVSALDGNKTNEVAAIIVPQEITTTNPFIKVRLNSGTGDDYATYTYTPNANRTFAKETSYKYTITLKSSGISVQSVEITPWTPGAEGSGDAILD